MTAAAWIFMSITWAIIAFFTVKFLWMVIKAQDQPSSDDE